MKLIAFSTLALLAGTASAQTNIYGMDVRLGNFITSDTSDYVGGLVDVAPQTEAIFALDFDETATTLWGVNNDTNMAGTFDLGTGVFTPVAASGGLNGATGLTCGTDGTWYMSDYDGINSNLYTGNPSTGFAFVGIIVDSIMIDISIDSSGNLYGHNLSDDNLYSIDTGTGAGTIIGATGQAANFAQGMDFDWTDDTLYATIYTGGGTGVFASMDLTTGAATVIQDTTPTNKEMIIACQATAGGFGTPYCTAAANSVSGSGSSISASGSNSIAAADLTLEASNAPSQPGIFYFGPDQVNIPFGNGFRCVGGTVTRMPVIFGSGGVFSYTVDFGTFGGVIGGLGTANFQCWYRDPAGGGMFFNLSDGLEITFVP